MKLNFQLQLFFFFLLRTHFLMCFWFSVLGIPLYIISFASMYFYFRTSVFFHFFFFCYCCCFCWFYLSGILYRRHHHHRHLKAKKKNKKQKNVFMPLMGICYVSCSLNIYLSILPTFFFLFR